MILKYQNEDGKSIEPYWYVPVIPVVLINGSEGIGTGFSSFVPSYSPWVIINNIRHKLDSTRWEQKPMTPWYRGFKGEIKKGKKEGCYVVNGQIKKDENDPTFSINELPIGRWTEDYKQILESIKKGLIEVS